ncbi:MAG: PEP-CTERM sorting domain-containing protein [Leptolyngbyaceae cyanobacterium]
MLNKVLAATVSIGIIGLTAGISEAAELRGFYSFDGNGDEATGLGPDLVQFGTVNYVDGLDGQAASFNRTGWLRADINSSGHVNPTFSWGAWVKLNDPNGWNIFLSNDNHGWDRFTQVQAGKWSVSHRGVVRSPYDTSTEWTFVAQTFDGTTQSLYVNDNPVFQTADSPNVSQSFIDIGRNANGAFPLDGLMDGVFFFDDVLSDAQVETIAKGGAGGCGVYAVAGMQNSTCDGETESIPEPMGVLGSIIAIGTGSFLKKRQNG